MKAALHSRDGAMLRDTGSQEMKLQKGDVSRHRDYQASRMSGVSVEKHESVCNTRIVES